MLKVCPYKCKESSDLNFRGKLKAIHSAYLIINIVWYFQKKCDIDIYTIFLKWSDNCLTIYRQTIFWGLDSISVQIKWTFEALRLGTWQSHQSSGQIMWLYCCANDIDLDKCANIKSATGCVVCVRYYYIYNRRWKLEFNLWYKCVAESTCDYRSHIALNYRFCNLSRQFLTKKVNDGMEKTHSVWKHLYITTWELLKPHYNPNKGQG